MAVITRGIALLAYYELGREGKFLDSVVDKLMLELATVHVDRGDMSPEAGSHMGLLMIRRAWLKVESTLTPEQMAKWDAMLDGEPAAPAAAQAGL